MKMISDLLTTALYTVFIQNLVLSSGLGMSEAIRASKELMTGNKWRLFCLEFSFFGWSILAALSLGIGGLFLRPYVEAAVAAFYREISTEKAGKQAPVYGEYTVV